MKWRWRNLWLLGVPPFASLAVIALVRLATGQISNDDSLVRTCVALVLCIALIVLFTWLGLRRPVYRSPTGKRFGLKWWMGYDFRRTAKRLAASQGRQFRNFSKRHQTPFMVVSCVFFAVLLLVVFSDQDVSRIPFPTPDPDSITEEDRTTMIDSYWDEEWTDSKLSLMSQVIRSPNGQWPGVLLSRQDMETMPLEMTVYYWWDSGARAKMFGKSTLAEYLSRVEGVHERRAQLRNDHRFINSMSGSKGYGLLLVLLVLGSVILVPYYLIALLIDYHRVKRFAIHEDAKELEMDDAESDANILDQ